MKKFALILTMLLTMGVYSFAENSEATKMERIEKNYVLKIGRKNFAKALKLSKNQLEEVNFTLDELEKNTMFANTMLTDESKERILANALKMNIRDMRLILKRRQYIEYLRLLNRTFINRNFDVTSICLKMEDNNGNDKKSF